MIQFKKFLFEQEFEKITSQTKHFGGLIKRKHLDGYIHSATVNGKEVQIGFDHQHDDPGTYHVDFAVNGDYGKHTENSREDIAVLHHVKRKVGQFIHEMKPTAIGFKPYDPSKKRMEKKNVIYNKMAQHFAAKHNGKHYRALSQDKSHHIHVLTFPHNETK